MLDASAPFRMSEQRGWNDISCQIGCYTVDAWIVKMDWDSIVYILKINVNQKVSSK